MKVVQWGCLAKFRNLGLFNSDFRNFVGSVICG